MNTTKYQFKCKICGKFIGTDFREYKEAEICSVCSMDLRRNGQKTPIIKIKTPKRMKNKLKANERRRWKK